jgi:hypothetical protein
MMISMKMAASRDESLYNVADTDQRFRGAYCLSHHVPMMEAVSFSETVVNNYYMVIHPRKQPSSES